MNARTLAPAGSTGNITLPAGAGLSVKPLGTVGLQMVAESVLVPPAGPAAAAVGTGGTFAAGTYFWKITAIGPTGESVGSTEVSATLVLNGSANLSWTAAPGATSYRVYRGTVTNSENVFYSVGNVVAFTDVNGASTGGAPPATTPTVTFKFQGSLDGVNWFDVFYLPAGSDTATAATQAVTSASAVAVFVDRVAERQYKFYRVVTTANTNVTFRAELYQLN